MSSLLNIAWENVVIGVLGGFFASSLFWLFSFVRSKMLERKYPIKGTYLTNFEDLENGQIVNTSALAVLKQRGKKITGKTFLSNNRTWILEGELTDTGKLFGLYFAEDPMDKGIGNFFLKVTNDRHMHGLWSGFDSVNNIVNSGRYTFTPLMQDYKITEAKREHVTQIISISDDELGKGFLSHKELAENAFDNKAYICHVALHGKKVLGFCLCIIASNDEVDKHLKVGHAYLPAYVHFAEKIGIIKTIAVSKDFRQRGIGHALTRAGYDEMANRKVQSVCSLAWKNGNVIAANGSLSALGLSPLREIESFWKEDSLKHHFDCPACGPPPCNCSAVLYFKAV